MNQTDILLVIAFSILFGIVLLGGMGIIIYTAHRTRLRQQLKLAEARTQYEQELRTVAHEVQEQLLKNISGELHDNIGQRLTLVHFQLEAQRRNYEPTLLEQANHNLVEAMKEVRSISHSLSADMLRQRGLFTMVCQEVRRLKQNGSIQVSLLNQAYEAEPLLKPDQQLMAFRLFQEAINNVFKHAEARNLYIRLQAEPDFVMEISDDGVGFDSQAAAGAGAGLQNMKQRAQLAGLACQISSTPGNGCTVQLRRYA